MKQQHKIFISSALIALSLGAGALPALAAASTDTTSVVTEGRPSGRGMGMMERGAPGVAGVVTAKSGTVLSLTDGRSGTVYTVETSGATFSNAGAASTLADIAVGDRVMIEGTVSGTGVTATTVHEGGMMRGGRGGMMGNASSSPMAAIAGDGKPVVMGTVASVSGASFTLTNNAGTYTIDASNAKVVKPGVTSATIGNVAVGDVVTVQGAITGTAVVASSVIDQTPVASATVSGSSPDTHRGFAGAFGRFFSKLFGF